MRACPLGGLHNGSHGSVLGRIMRKHMLGKVSFDGSAIWKGLELRILSEEGVLRWRGLTGQHEVLGDLRKGSRKKRGLAERKRPVRVCVCVWGAHTHKARDEPGSPTSLCFTTHLEP